MKSLLFSLLVSSLLVGTCERRPGQGAGANADTTALGPKNEIGSHPSPQIGGLSARDIDSIAQRELMRRKLDTGNAGKEPGKGTRTDLPDKAAFYDSIDQSVIRQKQLYDSLHGLKKESPEQK